MDVVDEMVCIKGASPLFPVVDKPFLLPRMTVSVVTIREDGASMGKLNSCAMLLRILNSFFSQSSNYSVDFLKQIFQRRKCVLVFQVLIWYFNDYIPIIIYI